MSEQQAEAAQSANESGNSSASDAGTPNSTTETKGVAQGATGGKKDDAQAKSEGSAGEQKPAGEEKKGEGTPVGAPEQYADFSLPEGVELDSDLMTNFRVTAKELGLPQDKAQKLVDIGSGIVRKQLDQIVKVRTEWKATSTADKEFGGKDYEANLAVALRGIKAHATPELEEFFRTSGVSEHPEVIRMFYRLGKLVKEDDGKVGEGGKTGGSGQPRQLKDRLYPGK